MVNWVKKHWEEGSGFAYIIRRKDTHDFCGVVDFFDYHDKHKAAEIGYWLINEAVGNGYMIEAVRTVERAAFERGVNRIQIRMDTRNIRSLNVAKRCGYHLDGTIRSAAWEDYFKSYRDEHVYSKLKSEWDAEQKK